MSWGLTSNARSWRMFLHNVKQAQQVHDITDRIPELLIGQLRR